MCSSGRCLTEHLDKPSPETVRSFRVRRRLAACTNRQRDMVITTIDRPVSKLELELKEPSGWRRFRSAMHSASSATPWSSWPVTLHTTCRPTERRNAQSSVHSEGEACPAEHRLSGRSDAVHGNEVIPRRDRRHSYHHVK